MSDSSSDIQKKLRALLPPDYAKDNKSYRPSSSSCMEERLHTLRVCKSGQKSKRKKPFSKERVQRQAVSKTQEEKGQSEFEGPIEAFQNYGLISSHPGKPACFSTLDLNHLTGTSLVIPRLLLLDGSSITPSQDSRQILDIVREKAISPPTTPIQDAPGKRASSISSISKKLAHRQLPEKYLSHICDVLRYCSSASSRFTPSSRESVYSSRGILTVDAYGKLRIGSWTSSLCQEYWC
jgi:hypothetical protein